MPLGKAPSWQSDMARLISARTEDGIGADIYKLTIKGRGDAARVTGFTPVSVNKASPRGDVVIILDWAASSDVFGVTTPTDRIASLVLPYFLSPQAGRSQTLAALPIHLIGHSRGGSVALELAKDFGSLGIWVDQLTTLDMRPVGDDPNTLSLSATVPSNVVFADNYYQRNGLTLGQTVEGAKNFNLTDLFPASSGLLDDRAHNDVWAYYGGTISPGLKSIGGNPIEPNWYTSDTSGPRDQLGFAYSSLGQTTRPEEGSRFSGADRESVSVSATEADRWDNIFLITPATTLQVIQGTQVATSFRVEDRNGDAISSLFLDPDSNPLNGNEQALPLSQQVSGGLGVVSYTPSIQTTLLTPGIYHLAARITNGTHTRYEYQRGTLTILPSSVPSADARKLTAKSPVKFTTSGQLVTVKTTRNASGTVFIPADGSGPTLVLDSTDSKSSASITSRSEVPWSAITIKGSISSLSAPRTALSSQLTISGTARSVSLGRATGATLSFGGSVTKFSATSLNDATLAAGFTAAASPQLINGQIEIKSLTVKATQSSHLAVAFIGTAYLGTLSGDTTSVFATRLTSLTARSSTGEAIRARQLTEDTAYPGLVVDIVSLA